MKELVKDTKTVTLPIITISVNKEKEVIDKPLVSASPPTPSPVPVAEPAVPAPSAAKPEFNLGQVEIKVDVKKEAAEPAATPVPAPVAVPVQPQALSQATNTESAIPKKLKIDLLPTKFSDREKDNNLKKQ